MIKQFIDSGEIVGTHGLAGEVRVNPWCDSPGFFKNFKTLYLDPNGNKKIKLKQCRVQKNVALLKLDGVDTVEQAAALRGTVLYIKRSDIKLEKGKYFIQDLIDCEVYDAGDNTLYGVITDVFATGANDVWEIKKDGKTYLFPAVKIFIDKMDVESGVITVNPPGGTFDE